MRFRRPAMLATEFHAVPWITFSLLIVLVFGLISRQRTVWQSSGKRLPAHGLARPAIDLGEHRLVLQLFAPERNQSQALLKLASGEQFELRSVQARLNQLFESATANLGQDAARATLVVIQADPTLRTGEVRTLVEACQSAGFDRFALNPQSQKGRH